MKIVFTSGSKILSTITITFILSFWVLIKYVGGMYTFVNIIILFTAMSFNDFFNSKYNNQRYIIFIILGLLILSIYPAFIESTISGTEYMVETMGNVDIAEGYGNVYDIDFKLSNSINYPLLIYTFIMSFTLIGLYKKVIIIEENEY